MIQALVFDLDSVITDTAEYHYRLERQKPAPDLFIHAAQQIGLAPAVCAIVEDAAARIEAALAGGFRSVGLGPREWVGQAEAVFPNLAEIKLQDLLKVLGKYKPGRES